MAPQHTFLRFAGGNTTDANIEATSGGGIISDDHLVERLHIGAKALQQGTYMHTMSYHQYMAVLLVLNGQAFMARGDTDRAIAYDEAAWALYPHVDTAAMALAQLYLDKGGNAVTQFYRQPQDTSGLDRAVESIKTAKRWDETFLAMGGNWDDYKVPLAPLGR